MPPNTDRIRLIERSLRCFVYGLLSLIPLVGLGLALLAIRLHFRTWAESGGDWNPAKRYLLGGFCLAWLGVLLSLGAMALFAVFLSQHYGF
jgi:hypothetical protein